MVPSLPTAAPRPARAVRSEGALVHVATSPGPHDVLIKVQAAGVNRPDVFQRLGGYPPPPGASATVLHDPA